MAQQERAIRTRQAILVAAAEVFDEVGYVEATISEILKRAGVTKGALYFHFSSKDELAQGVLAEQLVALPAVPRQDLKLQEVVDEALLLAYLLKRDTGHPIVRGGVRLTTEYGMPHDDVDRRASMQAWSDHGMSVFSAAKAGGELLPHVDLDKFAMLSAGAFTGVQVMSNITTDRADVLERVAYLYECLLSAVAVPGVLVQLDFAPERGAKVYETAMKRLRDEKGSNPA